MLRCAISYVISRCVASLCNFRLRNFMRDFTLRAVAARFCLTSCFVVFLHFFCVFGFVLRVIFSHCLLSCLTFFLWFLGLVLRSGKGARGGTDPQMGYAGGLVFYMNSGSGGPAMCTKLCWLGAVAGAGARQHFFKQNNVLFFFSVFF